MKPGGTAPASRREAERDALLMALTHHVRFLSEAQIARLWQRPIAPTRRALYRLRDQGWLRRQRAPTHPELPLERPVLAWQPGETAPDFERASYACKARWTQDPALMTAWSLSPSAAAQMGSGLFAGGINLPTATHDLHLGSLYVRYALHPEQKLQWLPEGVRQVRREERLPDVLLLSAQGPVRAWDFGGSANPDRIEKLYAYAVRYALPFELW